MIPVFYRRRVRTRGVRAATYVLPWASPGPAGQIFRTTTCSPRKKKGDGFGGVGEIACIDLAKKDNVSCTVTSRSFYTSYRVPRVGEIDLCVVRSEILLNGKPMSSEQNFNG